MELKIINFLRNIYKRQETNDNLIVDIIEDSSFNRDIYKALINSKAIKISKNKVFITNKGKTIIKSGLFQS